MSVYARESITLASVNDGTSVTVSSIKYATSTTNTKPSTIAGDFPSTLSKGTYLWARTTYSNGSVADTVSYLGTDGDITAAVSQATTAAQNIVNNLKIGGRNLILKSQLVSSNFAGSATATFQNNGLYVSGSSCYVYSKMKLKTDLVIGNQYTFSAIVASYSNDTYNYISLGNLDAFGKNAAYGDKHVSTTEQKVVFTFTAANNGNLVLILYPYASPTVPTSTAYMYAYDIKVESGNKATDWTPAPEDVNTSIALKSIKSIVPEYYLSSSILVPADGSWNPNIPAKTETTFIWSRNVITYMDNTTATSDPVLDNQANNFYTITTTNTKNISQQDTRITNEVQTITAVTTSLTTKQTTTDTAVSNLQQSTSESLTNLKTEQDETAKNLADYKNTVTTTYATKSEVNQTASAITNTISQTVTDAANKAVTTVLAETVVDARGFTVNTENADTHTTVDGTGVMVKDTQNNDVANFKASGSEIQKLKVINDVSMGAHNVQEFDDYEFNETTMADETTKTQGSADFWVGDIQ